MRSQIQIRNKVIGRIVVILKATLGLWIIDYIYTMGYETKGSVKDCNVLG